MPRTISLSKIHIKYKREYIKITDHPYFQALSTGNKHMYEECIKSSEFHQRRKPTATWEGIQKLIETIKESGFNPKISTFRVERKINKETGKKMWVVQHGRHRTCILRYLYGGNAKVTFSSNGKIRNITAEN